MSMPIDSGKRRHAYILGWLDGVKDSPYLYHGPCEAPYGKGYDAGKEARFQADQAARNAVAVESVNAHDAGSTWQWCLEMAARSPEAQQCKRLDGDEWYPESFDGWWKEVESIAGLIQAKMNGARPAQSTEPASISDLPSASSIADVLRQAEDYSGGAQAVLSAIAPAFAALKARAERAEAELRAWREYPTSIELPSPRRIAELLRNSEHDSLEHDAAAIIAMFEPIVNRLQARCERAEEDAGESGWVIGEIEAAASLPPGEIAKSPYTNHAAIRAVIDLLKQRNEALAMADRDERLDRVRSEVAWVLATFGIPSEPKALAQELGRLLSTASSEGTES